MPWIPPPSQPWKLMNHNDHRAQVQDSLIMSYVAIDNLNTTMMKQTEYKTFYNDFND